MHNASARKRGAELPRQLQQQLKLQQKQKMDVLALQLGCRRLLISICGFQWVRDESSQSMRRAAVMDLSLPSELKAACVLRAFRHGCLLRPRLSHHATVNRARQLVHRCLLARSSALGGVTHRGEPPQTALLTLARFAGNNVWACISQAELPM